MHILPTRGRPDICQRYFTLGKPEQPGVVLIDHDQNEMYGNLVLPDNWTVMLVPPMMGFVKKVNMAFACYPNEPWYAFTGDDCVGRTPHWDTLLAEEAKQGYIAWGNDLISGRCTHPYIHGDFCRDLGWVCHPSFKHLYVDTVWEYIATKFEIGRYMDWIITEAHHFSNGKLPFDQTAKERMEQDDARVWLQLQESRCLVPLMRKIHDRLESLCR